MDPSSTELLAKLSTLTEKKITLGFDGFVDELTKVVKTDREKGERTYYGSTREFGDYIVEKSNKNFALELELVETKIGGNMPIMANALAKFGPRLFCVGALGFPEIHDVFSPLCGYGEVLSFANPGYTIAMEFNGSKILMGKMGDLNHVDWSTLKQRIGIEAITRVFIEADLVCLLNWSELKNSNLIWRGLLREVLQKNVGKKESFAFVDLADFSRKQDGNILEAVSLLKELSYYWKVVLGLNLNEANQLYEVLNSGQSEINLRVVGESLFKRLSIHALVIRYSAEALAWDTLGFHQKKSLPITSPKLSTGAGDNFNAGFCAGLLAEFDLEMCLSLGHATSNYYMKQGASPNIQQLTSNVISPR